MSLTAGSVESAILLLNVILNATMVALVVWMVGALKRMFDLLDQLRDHESVERAKRKEWDAS